MLPDFDGDRKNMIAPAADPRAILRERPMRRDQWLIVGLCVAINFIDGYDIIAMAVAAPVVGPLWGMSAAALGFLFSAGLIGMTGGALLISPCADVLGRRPAILGALSLMVVGMAICAIAPGPEVLAVGRVITGIGMGGMTSSAGTLAMEYSSIRHRELSVAMVVIGYPIGSVLGSTLAIPLLARFGWEAIFAGGSLLALLLFPLLLWRLPESLEYLLGRQPAGALARANRVAVRLGLPPLAMLPPLATHEGRGGLGQFAAPEMLRRLARVCTGQAANMFSWYFILNWATKWVAETGVSTAVGVSFSIFISIGGVAGGLAAGALSARLGLRRVTTLSLVGVATAIILFPHVPPDGGWLTLLGLFLGAVMFASASAIYSTIALAFPPQVRATGAGLASTAGRAGSIFGPLSAGFLVDGGLSKALICLFLALPALLSAAILWGTPRDRTGAPADEQGAAY